MSTKQTDINLFNYTRRATVEVNVGGVKIGNGHTIKVQSMTNTGTMDTEGSVEQAIRIVDKGGELVRLTTQGNREAVNLGNIKQQLVARGYQVPLVADVHFNASVADTATKALICRRIMVYISMIFAVLVCICLPSVGIVRLSLGLFLTIITSFYSSTFVMPAVWAATYKARKQDQSK